MNEKRTLIMIYEETFKHLQKTLLNDNYLYCKFPKKNEFFVRARARVCGKRSLYSKAEDKDELVNPMCETANFSGAALCLKLQRSETMFCHKRSQFFVVC